MATPKTLRSPVCVSWIRHAGLYDLPKPTIAKIRGIAAGAGLSLALCCDLTVVSTTARLSEIFARRGLSVDGGSSWLLPRLIGLHNAAARIFIMTTQANKVWTR